MLWVCSPSHAGLETLFWVVYEMDHGVTPGMLRYNAQMISTEAESNVQI